MNKTKHNFWTHDVMPKAFDQLTRCADTTFHMTCTNRSESLDVVEKLHADPEISPYFEVNIEQDWMRLCTCRHRNKTTGKPEYRFVIKICDLDDTTYIIEMENTKGIPSLKEVAATRHYLKSHPIKISAIKPIKVRARSKSF